LVSGTAGAVQTVDAGVPAYQKVNGISGNLSSVVLTPGQFDDAVG